ncbi:MAG: hypothetical protein FIA97_09605 [Methylococcaceae bacterium]|nr:hypothetical protein [Methylococcaceae bacterium]
MGLDRAKVEDVFRKLGEKLVRPTTLCVFGSTPAILLGQPTRQTQDVDVWFTQSVYDSGDLSRACVSAGVLYDPMGELDPAAVYLQIVRPGVVALPNTFETETIGRWGNLTVVMPTPSLLSAAKLVRGSENDVNDIVWWVQHRKIEMQQIEGAIRAMPNPRHRETASENLIFVKLVFSQGGG